jgi:coproporphyrinogen III oxidase-like Fe-S oxidoreductase
VIFEGYEPPRDPRLAVLRMKEEGIAVLLSEQNLDFAAAVADRAYVIERIMCDGTIDLEIAGGFFDAEPDWYEPEVGQLDILARDGLLIREGARITLTPAGIGLARIVASTFDSYLRHDRARHSVAL